MRDDDDLEPDLDLRDRLLHVENSLLLLKAKSRYFADWDNSEVERLERLRHDLRIRSERAPDAAVPPRAKPERPPRTTLVPGSPWRA
jgi:hypothetical protein